MSMVVQKHNNGYLVIPIFNIAPTTSTSLHLVLSEECFFDWI
jgi:hypothetical protein